MNNIEKITSFTVNHDYITPGFYISRIDGDITTFDLRTRKPNAGEYMDNLTMHSVEHMFATYVRNSAIGSSVIYFGPMGCQTGFYLLVKGVSKEAVFDTTVDVLNKIITHEGDIFGRSRVECGNYLNLDLNSSKIEAKAYLDAILNNPCRYNYPER